MLEQIVAHEFHTVVVGAGAAGMNAAVKLYEFMRAEGIERPGEKIAVVTGGLSLGASRMSGSDKQTYYKMGTSPNTADTAKSFAESLTEWGCCHGDLAMVEAIGSLRGFYHLVESGVPFPHDVMGSFVGYKTDHDPFERATSAGPETSKFMSECLERKVRQYGVGIYDGHELVQLITDGTGDDKRVIAILTLEHDVHQERPRMHLFYAKRFVLAAGGPGGLYKQSVYPKGQVGIHGLAFEAGLAAENLTESQFGLASTAFRWNVSGSYMQVVPRIYSTDRNGEDKQDFLCEYFPDRVRMATAIFLKGYQWPFDPQRVSDYQSSLIDMLVLQEMKKGRRVYMDFRENPVYPGDESEFSIEELLPEGRDYLLAIDVVQGLPIERLAFMNPLAIDIYKKHAIDLWVEPLEIAVCAQHHNGGFAVDRWWRSTIANVHVVGEMAGTHGVKRPGGAALNAGQVGSLRAAQWIAGHMKDEVEAMAEVDEHDRNVAGQAAAVWGKRFKVMEASKTGVNPLSVLETVQEVMSRCAGPVREIENVRKGLKELLVLYRRLELAGMMVGSKQDYFMAVQGRHLLLSGIAFLKGIAVYLEQGGGSRGSFVVLDSEGAAVVPEVCDCDTGRPIKERMEAVEQRDVIWQVCFNKEAAEMYDVTEVDVRPVPSELKPFETAWREYREGRFYS